MSRVPSSTPTSGLPRAQPTGTSVSSARSRFSSASVLTLFALAGSLVFSAWLNAGASKSPALPARSGQMPGMNMGVPTRTPLSKLPTTPVQTPTRMGNLVMPPGMIMTNGTSLEAMRDMAAVDLSKVTYTAPSTARGD